MQIRGQLYGILILWRDAGDTTVLRMKAAAENATYRGMCRTEKISVMEIRRLRDILVITAKQIDNMVRVPYDNIRGN